MSKFRERAAEVKAAGEAERGNFQPEGVPKRMYQWWLSESVSSKALAIRTGQRRENFCHFWRVVLIWAPLMALATIVFGAIDAAVEKTPRWAGITAAIVLPLAVISTIVTTVGDWSEFLWFLAAMLAIVAGAIGIVALATFLSDKYDWFVPALVFTVAGAAVVGLLWLGVYMMGLAFFGWLLGFAVLFLVGGFLIFKLGERVQAKRALARAKRNAEREAALDAYLNGDGPNPYDTAPSAKREPSAFELRLKAIGAGIGDFLVLLTQVVRVNKWKICPLVDIEPAPRNKIDPDSGWETA